MALTICQDCEKEVSTLAKACPNCGRPTDQDREETKVVHYPREGYICQTCGIRGYPEMKSRGSWRITGVLLLFFIVPGVLYSIWRQTSRYPVCPWCKEPGMIPIDSPHGRQLFQKFGHTYTPEKENKNTLNNWWETASWGRLTTLYVGSSIFCISIATGLYFFTGTIDNPPQAVTSLAQNIQRKEQLQSIIVRGKEVKIGDTFDQVLPIIPQAEMVRQEPRRNLDGGLYLLKHYLVDGRKFSLSVARANKAGPYRVVGIEEYFSTNLTPATGAMVK